MNRKENKKYLLFLMLIFFTSIIRVNGQWSDNSSSSKLKSFNKLYTVHDNTKYVASMYDNIYNHITGSDHNVEDIYEYFYEEYEEGKRWMIDSYFKNFFNLDSHLIERTTSKWSTDGYSFKNNRKHSFEYNQEGQIVLETYYEYIDFSWVANYKKIYAYDSLGRQMNFTHLTWNKEQKEWNNFKYREYDYANDSILDVINYYEWSSDSSEWLKQGITEITESSKQDTTVHTFKIWQSSRNEWIPNSRTKRYQTKSGLLVDETDQIWDTINDTWNNFENTIIHYNDSGKVTQRSTFNWDDENEEWIPNAKEVHVYNAKMQLIESVKYSYVVQIQLNSLKYEYFYNNSGQWQYTLCYSWDDNNQEWIYKNKWDIHFNPEDYENSTFVNPFDDKDNLIYPNPVENTIYIRYSPDDNKPVNVRITDISGKTIANEFLQPQNGPISINMSHFPKGIYLLKYNNGSSNRVQKIIKK